MIASPRGTCHFTLFTADWPPVRGFPLPKGYPVRSHDLLYQSKIIGSIAGGDVPPPPYDATDPGGGTGFYPARVPCDPLPTKQLRRKHNLPPATSLLVAPLVSSTPGFSLTDTTPGRIRFRGACPMPIRRIR
ncbi:hypothetical protein GWK47_030876 [Chionoecetes opilio]|uniref:Uncharacterized protein n=1 Tax=Chionoecetes opilio TaxID=41210 RepID=A0A8J4YLC7_CHIOP|nr:hypothetical protein GWK47_030876 [Chionoecetes opilio]